MAEIAEKQKDSHFRWAQVWKYFPWVRVDLLKGSQMDHLEKDSGYKDGVKGQGGPTCGLPGIQGAARGMTVASQRGIFIQVKEP